MIFRALVLAVFASALPAFADAPIVSPVAPDADEATVVCMMQFLPATCTIEYGGETYSSTGSNACVALETLVQQVRDAALWWVDPANDVRNGATCTEQH